MPVASDQPPCAKRPVMNNKSARRINQHGCGVNLLPMLGRCEANKKPKQSVRTVWAFVPSAFWANPHHRSNISIYAFPTTVNKQLSKFYTFRRSKEGQ